MSHTEQMQEWIDHHSKRADIAEAINVELLDALKAIHRRLEQCRDIIPPYLERGIAIARDAIEKATGGAE